MTDVASADKTFDERLSEGYRQAEERSLKMGAAAIRRLQEAKRPKENGRPADETR